VTARKTLSALSVLAAFCALSVLGLPAYGQKQNPTGIHPDGLVDDWSHHHAVYPRVGPLQSLLAVQNNPRAIHSWQAAARAEWRRANVSRSPHNTKNGMQIDWNISLGNGSTAAGMFPAKFNFDPNATANCTTDFIVFPVNIAGSTTQANLVAFNNLYSGTGNGICNRTPVGGVDTGKSATTLWSYNIDAAGGAVATSPALSLDGTKVAFVETNSTGPAHFHVLAWKSGDTLSTDLQSTTSPVHINTFSSSTPAAGSGTATDLPLGLSGNDTLSSPFVEYGLDRAYVGNDTGTLFRIQNVFCTFSQCTGAGSPAPSLDNGFGTSGAVTTGCGGKLTAPVVDGSTRNVLVACSDGKLYGFTPAGVALTNSPLTVGDGTALGGIVDAPIVDGVNGFVYVVSRSGSASLGPAATGNPVLVQAKTDLSLPRTATLGVGAAFNLHAPALNNSYLSGSGTPLLYEVAGGGTTTITLYGISFNGSLQMTTGTPANASTFFIGAFEISPLTEFFDGTEDRVFESALGNFSGNLASFNVTTTFPAAVESSATEGSGTSAIVVDNSSTSSQADSIYFGVLGAAGTNPNSAVKLTQSALK